MTHLTSQAPASGKGRGAAPMLPKLRDLAVDYRRVEPHEREPSLKRLVLAGSVAVVVGFGGFFGWAASASLDSAAVSTGTVIVVSKRKTVSHLEGGILQRLLVQEGDVVREGQPLLRLDDTRARSELHQLRARRWGLMAKLARLRAEQTGATEIAFPDELLAATDPVARDVVAAERRFFDRRQQTWRGQLDVKRKTIEQHAAQIVAYGRQIEANARQSALIQEQRDAIAGLVDKGFATRSQLIELDGRLSELSGLAAQLAGNEAAATKAKAAGELDVASTEMAWQSDIAGEITAAQVDLADTQEKTVAQEDVMARLDVKAPQDGIVANIQVRTTGGAIGAGQPLMDIVPEKEPMVVEAHAGLRDIDTLRIGAPARIRLTAYNQRSHAPLDGTLTYVAADQTLDPNSGQAYYVIRAEISPDALAGQADVRLYPGMPAEVLVINRPRRAIDYLLAPITDSFDRAFHEE